MNKIQYIALTHTSKEMAKHNKQTCNTLHSVYYKEMTFDEVADLLETGNSFGRVGNKTDFVAIDIDETTVNIQQVFDKFKDSNKYRISYSSSNNPLKYHVLVRLDKEISIDDYKTVLEEEFDKFKSEVCGRCDIMVLDKNASHFYQCFYGQSVDNEIENILEGSRRLFKWCKKDDKELMFYNEEHNVKVRPSMNSADYCYKHKLLTVKEDKRFDVILPCMTNGKLKLIKEGYRYEWCRMIGTKILMRIFHLNHTFNEGWTKWDFIDTIEWAFRSNVVKADNFEDDIRSLKNFFDNKWDILVSKTYEEQCEILEPYFNCSKKQYKSRSYNPTVMSNLILEHQFDDTTILFTDKDELKSICKDLMLDYYRFIKFCKSVNFDVKFECVKPTNSFNDYIDSCLKATLPNGSTIIQIDRKHAMNRHFIKFCKSNDIKYTTKCLP